MTIAVGDRLPDVKFKTMGADGPTEATTADVFAGKTVALFAVPGAFTPTCHAKHMPGFLENMDAFAGKGVTTIACTSINDIFVLNEWAKATGAAGKITMLADGNGEFAKAIGMDIDLGIAGLGVRSKRYAMLVEDGVVKALNVEESPGQAEKSSAANLLKSL